MDKLFLDCEFNGFGGDLISLAIVGEDGQEFYEVLSCKDPVDWVVQNVFPVMKKHPVEYSYFQIALQGFIWKYKTPLIIADWPEDFIHFFSSLTRGHGQCMSLPDVYTLLTRVDSHSEIPHNALHDARALRKAFLGANV